MRMWARGYPVPTATAIIAVNRQAGANVVEVAEGIRKMLPVIGAELPGSIRITPVVDGSNPDRAGKLGADDRQQLADALGHLDDVSPGLPVDGYDRRRRRNRIASGPHPHVYAFVLHRFARRGDVAQIDRRPVRRADDEFVVLLCGLELPFGAQQRRAARRVELARAGVTRRAPDRV